jgi:SNF2 family DNA or RNA helicase
VEVEDEGMQSGSEEDEGDGDGEGYGDEDDSFFDVLLLTYSTFERDSEQSVGDRALLKRVPWGAAVCDEAHALKNQNAARSRKLR